MFAKTLESFIHDAHRACLWFLVLLSPSHHHQMITSIFVLTSATKTTRIKIMKITWAPFMNGSILSGLSFSSRDFTLNQTMTMMMVLVLNFHENHSDIFITVSRPGQIRLCPLKQGLLLEINLCHKTQLIILLFLVERRQTKKNIVGEMADKGR